MPFGMAVPFFDEIHGSSAGQPFFRRDILMIVVLSDEAKARSSIAGGL
jgi:hypothetical protein